MSRDRRDPVYGSISAEARPGAQHALKKSKFLYTQSQIVNELVNTNMPSA